MKRPSLLRSLPLRPTRPRMFLSVRHSSSRREVAACLTLNTFVLSGWLLPFLSSLPTAQAREIVAAPRPRSVSAAASSPKAKTGSRASKTRKAAADAPPRWYRKAQTRESKLAQAREAVQAEMKRDSARRGAGVRLAQLGGADGGGLPLPPSVGRNAQAPGVSISPMISSEVGNKQVSGFRLLKESFPVALRGSASLYVPNPYTSPLKVDLSNGRVPTQKEVSGLGSSCGALAPAAPAEPAKFQDAADDALKGQGYERGLSTQMPPADELVLDPPRFKKAKHLEEVRERVKSARKQNRDLAGAMMDWNTANWGGAKQKLEQFAKDFPQSPWAPEALIHLADLAKSSAQPNEAEDGYRKVMAMTSDKAGDMSFEAHQKAYERWADLYLREGRYGQARPMLEDMVKNDLHWRRVTWAYSWLMQLNAYGADQKKLLAQLDCGSKALATMLVDMGHAHAGREVAALSPTNKRGFSLADLQLMGQKKGVPLVGFRARAAQLVGAPLPLILHYAARGVAPMTARRVQNAKLRGVPTRSLEDYAHFVVVRGYDARSHLWSVFNPQEGTRAFLSSAQLDKESSGTGLMTVNAAPMQAPAKAVWLANWPKGRGATASKVQAVSLPSLSRAQMQGIVGTCYAVRAPGGGLGCGRRTGRKQVKVRSTCGAGHGACTSRQEPSVSVDPISQNIFITDAPVWYDPAKGPSVDVSMSYNSQDASNYDSPTGNKWTFGFTSHVAEMPNQVSVFMPDGAQDVYTIPSSATSARTTTSAIPSNTTPTDPGTGTTTGAGTITTTTTTVADSYVAGSPRGVFSTLTKTAKGTFSLKFQDGSVWSYGIPSGTASSVPTLLSQTDRWNQSLTLQYGTIGGKVVPFTLTDADGKLTRFQYDGNGHLIYAQTPDERQASFSYDASGNLIQCVDAAGQAFQYAYDGSATVTQLNSAQGAWTFNVKFTAPYGGQSFSDFRTTITDPTQSHPQSFVFTNVATDVGGYWFTDHVGNKTTIGVTSLSDTTPFSVIASETPPVGSGVNYSYDTTSSSHLTAPVRVSDGRTTTVLTYNAQGQVTQSQTGSGYVDPNNARTTQLNYDANGLDVVGAQVSGTATNSPSLTQQVLQSVSYNSYHQPLAVVDAQGHETDTSYTPWGAPSSVTVHEGTVNHVTQYAYGQTQGTNEFNRVVGVVQDGVTQATYTYDASGRVRTSTDITGQTTLVRYNNLDAPLGVYYADGTSQTTDYTCCALPGMTTDRSGRRSYSDYDQLKRLVRVQDADGQTLQFDYNADGDCLSMMDANGVKTRWVYDTDHRPVAKQYADGSGEGWDYTQYGDLNSATNGRGARTTFGYSNFGELTNVNYPNTSTTASVSLAYDLLGRKASMSDGIGTTGWNYDGVGHLQSESGPFGNDGINYSYDSLNRLQSLSIGRDATSSDSENFGYDGLGRLASLTASVGGFGNVGTFNYGYVGNSGIMSRMDRPNGTSTLLSYENLQDTKSLHRLTGVQDISTASGANIAGFGYGYDSPGTQNGFLDNRTSQTRAYGAEAAQMVSYGYNPTSMLQGEGAAQGGASTPALSKSYSFDAMGNRTQMSDAVAKTQISSTYNSLNQLTSTNSFSTSSGQAVASGSNAFGYDGDGNMNAVSAKDATGSVTSQTSYAYDDASRLIGITTPTLSKWQFVYDGASRLRISRSWLWQNTAQGWAWVQNSEKRRVYLGMDVVQERDSQNNVIASYPGGQARSTATGTVFYGYVGNGSVTSLTDSTGAVVGSYTYDAWGNILNSLSLKAQENPYRYSGKEQLAGYYSYGYRFYNSGLGRWINRDPLRESGGANLYGFVNNSPTNQVDLYGLNPLVLVAAGGLGIISIPAWVPIALLVVGAVIIIGVIAYTVAQLPTPSITPPTSTVLSPPISLSPPTIPVAPPTTSAPSGSTAIPKGPIFCPVRGGGEEPDPRAVNPNGTGRPHTTFRPGHWHTWLPQTNPQNPNPWIKGPRGDMRGPDHKGVPTPHVHEPPDGDAHPATGDELMKGPNNY